MLLQEGYVRIFWIIAVRLLRRLCVLLDILLEICEMLVRVTFYSIILFF